MVEQDQLQTLPLARGWVARQIQELLFETVAKEQLVLMVPVQEAEAELLRAVIEAFVLREGTEYGAREYTLDEKVAHVELQLRRGEARIVYDPNTQSVDIRRSPP